MLYREIIAVCSEIHTKHINTLCGQNLELNFCHPEVFDSYINIQLCYSQTQKNFIVFIIVLGQYVSILIE